MKFVPNCISSRFIKDETSEDEAVKNDRWCKKKRNAQMQKSFPKKSKRNVTMFLINHMSTDIFKKKVVALSFRM